MGFGVRLHSPALRLIVAFGIETPGGRDDHNPTEKQNSENFHHLTYHDLSSKPFSLVII